MSGAPLALPLPLLFLLPGLGLGWLLSAAWPWPLAADTLLPPLLPLWCPPPLMRFSADASPGMWKPLCSAD